MLVSDSATAADIESVLLPDDWEKLVNDSAREDVDSDWLSDG